MKKPDFLNKLEKEGKLELVEPSEDIANSYLQKSSSSLKASESLLRLGFLEEPVSMAYYSMYYCLLALMMKCGIKCENHSGNIILLRELFGEQELYKLISYAKTERIDKQYYVGFEITEKDVEETIEISRQFTTKLRLTIENLKNQDINNARSRVFSESVMDTN